MFGTWPKITRFGPNKQTPKSTESQAHSTPKPTAIFSFCLSSVKRALCEVQYVQCYTVECDTKNSKPLTHSQSHT